MTIYLKKRVEQDPDFVNLPRFDYSLTKLMLRHPDGVSDKLIAQGLMIEEIEVQPIYEGIVVKLKKTLRVK